MDSAPTPSPQPPRARRLLEARLGQEQAPLLAAELRALQVRPLEIDASRVETVSTLCLQVLLAAARSWRAAGGELSLVGPSPAFRAALDHLGLGIEAFQSPGAACR